jgi:putative membrane protein insertion efficiency factor
MITKIVLKVLEFYKIYISQLWGSHCRFHPSCSQYSQEAISHYGLAMGLAKALLRLGRCHPFSAGGFDPVAK